MALPAPQQNGFAAPGSPADTKRDLLPRSAGADTARRRADDSRRLRRVKDSKEQLKRRTTRARGASYSTIDTTASNTSAGRSYTVANVNNGVIYLRYAYAQCFFIGGGSSRADGWVLTWLRTCLCTCLPASMLVGDEDEAGTVAMSANREGAMVVARPARANMHHGEAATDRPSARACACARAYAHTQYLHGDANAILSSTANTNVTGQSSVRATCEDSPSLIPLYCHPRHHLTAQRSTACARRAMTGSRVCTARGHRALNLRHRCQT